MERISNWFYNLYMPVYNAIWPWMAGTATFCLILLAANLSLAALPFAFVGGLLAVSAGYMWKWINKTGKQVTKKTNWITGSVVTVTTVAVVGATVVGGVTNNQIPRTVSPVPTLVSIIEVTAITQMPETAFTPTYQSPTPTLTLITMPAPTDRSTYTPISTKDSTIYYPIPGCAASRIQTGDWIGLESGIDYVSVRSSPDTSQSDNKIGRIEGSGVAEIIGGPECNYGWLLWKIRTDGVVGWIPETDGKEFWIRATNYVPVDFTPSVQVIISPTSMTLTLDNRIKVPNVIGITVEEAKRKLQDAGFNRIEERTGYDTEFQTGYIYKQEPLPGEIFNPLDVIIYLYKSLGIPPTPAAICADCIVFNSGGSDGFEIYMMHANDKPEQEFNLTNNPADDSDPSWSPDRNKIVFESNRDGNWEIYTMNFDGSNQINLTNNPAPDGLSGGSQWSPNGQKIAFLTHQSEIGSIYTMNADGSKQTNITDIPEGYEVIPSIEWSPDGNKMTFVACTTKNGYGYENCDIFVINSDGTKLTSLVNSPNSIELHATWSPDGNQIAFDSDLDGNDEIYLMNYDGSGITNISNSPNGSDYDPTWSPNGKKIAFTSDRDGPESIYIMNPDGTGQTNLTIRLKIMNKDPVWSPDGTMIAFTCMLSTLPSFDVAVVNINGALITYTSCRDCWASDW